MPTYRDVEVEVLCGGPIGVPEYGISKNERMKTKSCFIKSETDQRFQIRIQPRDDIIRDGEIENQDDEDEYDIFGRSNALRTLQWHLVATLRLDGRSQIEKRALVVLDRRHDHFPNDEGEVILRSTCVRDDDGFWKECEWLFKDVGIDLALESLALGNSDAVLVQPEDELADAFGAMSAVHSIEQEEKSKVGQIEVRLDRCTIGHTVRGIARQILQQKDMTQLQGSSIGDAGHLVGRSLGQLKQPPLTTTYYTLIDGEESPYAVFRFNYCDEKKLRKLGFLSPLPTPKSTNKRTKALEMAAAVQQKCKPVRGPISYKFRNLDTDDVDDGAEGDDEGSESEFEDEKEGEEDGPSEDLPLGEVGEKLGELGLDRHRKRDEDEDDGDGEEGLKKVRAE